MDGNAGAPAVRVPIEAPSTPYLGPATEAAVMQWFTQCQADRARVFKTNMALAVAAGELTDDVGAIFAEADRVDAEARLLFQRDLGPILERCAREGHATLAAAWGSDGCVVFSVPRAPVVH